MTRIVALSDTHNKHKQIKVPEGDILIHAGDFTMTGKVWKVESFLRWFGAQPHKYKVFTAGNHDWLAQKDPGLFKQLVDETSGVVYLQDSMAEVEGFKIWGSPWSPKFYDWAFNANETELGQKWNMIPGDCDIVITHGPAYGVGDLAPRANKFGNFGGPKFEHVGCKTLYQTLVKNIRPKLHVYGHIHEGYGVYDMDGIVSVNASSLNGAYQYVNLPIVIDI